jgi:hypothetical protein
VEIVSDTAVWYHSGLPPAPIRWVLVRDPSGEREPQAFLSTDLTAKPEQILGWFVSRWRMETTLQEARTHLGVETQRQWSDLANLRTTPALLGLFSLVTVWANWMARTPIGAVRPRTAAWYDKGSVRDRADQDTATAREKSLKPPQQSQAQSRLCKADEDGDDRRRHAGRGRHEHEESCEAHHGHDRIGGQIRSFRSRAYVVPVP